MSRKLNREFKNSVFIDLFSQKPYRMQLLQTLHPEMTDLSDADLKAITLKQVVTNHPYNDLALQVKDQLMLFVEAQSTWSENILIRILLYLADTIQSYLHDEGKDIHDRKQVHIPIPEFYVLYSGKRSVPERISLRRDFFRSEQSGIDLEARVFTSGSDDIIGQYILFCRVFDEQIKAYGRIREAAEKAIRICMDRDVLKDYLRSREKEVIDIMIMLFDQEYAVHQYGVAQKERRARRRPKRRP